MRVGVVGVGAMGQLHARVYAELDGCELVGVHDIDPDRSREVAGRHQVESFKDLDSLLGRVDAVTVAVPTPDHHSIGLHCMGAGCDVLIEKPLAPTLDQADSLIGTAEKEGRVLQVGHIERYNPAVAAMAARVENPGFIEIDRLGSLAPRSLETDVVLDLMIHDLQILHAIDPSPVYEVRATGIHVLSDRIDIANVRLEFESGCVANLTASRVSAERVRKLRIFLRDRYYSLDYQDQEIEGFELLAGPDERRIQAAPLPVVKAEPLKVEVRHFIAACNGASVALVTGQQGRRALATALDVLAAISGGAETARSASSA